MPNGIPRKYYAVTEYGTDLLKQVGMYEQIGIPYDMYEGADLRLANAGDRPVTIEDIDSDYCKSVPGRPHDVVRSYR